jgi:hypothetical protein
VYVESSEDNVVMEANQLIVMDDKIQSKIFALYKEYHTQESFSCSFMNISNKDPIPDDVMEGLITSREKLIKKS